MQFLKNILSVLDGKMPTPSMYGWFHIMCLFLMVALCVVFFIFRKRISQKTVNIILLTTGIVCILFEVYKLLIMNFDSNGLTDFMWYIFPFQFCSTPMYIMLLSGILRKGKIYDCLISYLATFAFFAGVAVMLYPSTVFISLIGINIQTMIVHGSMVVIAFMLLVTKTAKFEWKTLLKASIVFVIMVTMAMIMNLIFNATGSPDTFNMFFINPRFTCEIPLLSAIQPNVPYIFFLLIYILGFTLCATIFLAISIGINKLASLKYIHIDNQTEKSEQISIDEIENKNSN